VNAVLKNVTTAGNPDRRYFDGTYPKFIPVSQNFLAGGTPLQALNSSLVSFFATALQCDQVPAYKGGNMSEVHKNIYVNQEAFDYFVSVVLGVMKSAGVTDNDVGQTRVLLNGLAKDIIPTTLCSQYNTYGKPYTSENDFITKTYDIFAGLVTTPGTFTRRYFDGNTPPRSVNYTLGGAPLTRHLTAVGLYFGSPGWASCLGSNFGPYTGSTDNRAIHLDMMVDSVAFDQWANFHVQAFSQSTGLPPSSPVLVNFNNTLYSFKSQIVTVNNSICDKYTVALKLPSTNELVTKVVSTAFEILKTNSTTAPYFNGQIPKGSTDFNLGGPATTKLATNLITFFGKALGCNDQSIPPYAGQPLPQVHQDLNITVPVFNAFNEIVVKVLLDFGVTSADGNAVLSLLNSLQGQIVPGSVVTPPPRSDNPVNVPVSVPVGQSICDKYAMQLKLTGNALITFIVNKSVMLIVTNATTKDYFNGVIPERSTNFLSNAMAFRELFSKLVSFFGNALGCTDGTITPASLPSLLGTHASLKITLAAFNTFNNIIAEVAAGAGVSVADVDAIKKVLASRVSEVVPSATICERYASFLGLTHRQLMFAIINATIYDLANDPRTVDFFDGTFPRNSPNFLEDIDALNRLYNGLIRFFGSTGRFGCSDNTIKPLKREPDLKAIHRNMGISKFVFTVFNNIVVRVLNRFGVSAADQATSLSLLNSFETSIVLLGCNPNLSPKAPCHIQDGFVPKSLNGGQIAAIIICAFIIAILVGLACAGLTMVEKSLHFK